MKLDAGTTIAVVLVCFSVLELGFRAVVPKLSANSRTLALAPERARRIAEEKRLPSMLILGNSTGRDGIDAELLANRLAADGISMLIEHQPADSSTPRDWYYELKNMYLPVGAAPDWLLLPEGNAMPLLRQKDPNEDLVSMLLGLSDLPAFFSDSGITDREEQARLALMNLSSLYGFRGRLQKRLLTLAVPGFEELRGWMARSANSAGAPNDAAPPARTMEPVNPEVGPSLNPVWLSRLEHLLEPHGTRVVVVAIPTDDLKDGRIPAPDRAAAERFGWEVVEPGAGAGFTRDDRPDGLHLTHEARERFSVLLATSLVPILQTHAPPE